VRGKGSKLGDPFPKVMLSQDRLPKEPSFFISLSLLSLAHFAQMSLRANVTQPVKALLANIRLA